MALSDIIPYVGLQEVKNIKKLLKEVIAEFLGTMFLVILGCGACIQPANQQPAIQQPFNHTNKHFGVLQKSISSMRIQNILTKDNPHLL